MIQASIDLGTNTCLLLIAEVDDSQPKGPARVKKVLLDRAKVVRLGQGVDQGRVLSSEAMERTLGCLKEFVAAIQDAGVNVSGVSCAATSQARDAENGTEFFDRIKSETGLCFKILSGQEEAQASFRGALLPGIDPARSVVIDIGGGSTEFMSAFSGQSLDIGAVRFTERYLKSDPVTDEEFWLCQEKIDEALQGLSSWREALPAEVELMGVAGTVVNLAQWHLNLDAYDSSQLEELTLFRGDIHRMVEELKWRTQEERKLLPGVEPLRADVLLAGALILWRSMEVLQLPHCRVSPRGLRYGII
jgi:exopolyphosphatase / guanosine-5'-triphosphate,3'-diphosphate pyrophosphatase